MIECEKRLTDFQKGWLWGFATGILCLIVEIIL